MDIHHPLKVGEPCLISQQMIEGVGCLDDAAKVHPYGNHCHQCGQHLIPVPEVFEELFAVVTNGDHDVDKTVHGD